MLLVGDIGGTHARFAFATAGDDGAPIIEEERKLVCADYASVEEAINGYFRLANGDGRPKQASIAVAGPVTDESVEFTNSGWKVSARRICEEISLDRTLLVNDLEAVSLAWPFLRSGDIEDVFPSAGWRTSKDTLAVIGIGTGFGMSVMPGGDPGRVISTEAGHTSFAPSNPFEQEVSQAFFKRFGRVSVERLISGRGLADLHQTIAEIEGRRVAPRSSSQVVAMAGRGFDRLSKLSVRMFCEILGSVAGDCALVAGARGGVYLRGHLVQAIANSLRSSRFRERFEDKGRMRSYLQAIPTRLIVHPEPALLGAAAIALKRL